MILGKEITTRPRLCRQGALCIQTLIWDSEYLGSNLSLLESGESKHSAGARVGEAEGPFANPYPTPTATHVLTSRSCLPQKQ